MNLLIAFILLGVASCSGVVLDCSFMNHTTNWGTKYSCVVNTLRTTLKDRTVIGIKGEHLPGKSNTDVQKVMIKNQFCPYIPIGIGEFFTNLEVLYIMKSNVDHLTSSDLNGLDKLKIFDVSHNPITKLHKEYFIGHESLEIISFYDCTLMSIEKGVLDPLINLKEGHFELNVCVNYKGDDESKIDTLKKEIENCDYSTGDSHQIDSSSEDIEEHTFRDSFVRRNAVVIIIFLLLIIVVLAAFMYKINAFNRQNWQ